MQQSETQLRLITDALPALIAYIDRRQCYQFVNRTYEGWQKQPLTKIKGFFSLINDISDRKANEQMKDKFVSV